MIDKLYEVAIYNIGDQVKDKDGNLLEIVDRDPFDVTRLRCQDSSGIIDSYSYLDLYYVNEQLALPIVTTEKKCTCGAHAIGVDSHCGYCDLYAGK